MIEPTPQSTNRTARLRTAADPPHRYTYQGSTDQEKGRGLGHRIEVGCGRKIDAYAVAGREGDSCKDQILQVTGFIDSGEITS